MRSARALTSVPGVAAKRVLLVGLGESKNISRSVLHDAFAAAMKSIAGKKLGTVAIAVPTTSLDPKTTALAAGVGALQACFGPGLRKREPSRFTPGEIALSSCDDATLQRIQIEGAAIAVDSA